jgi:branched-chain amino acid aminotransferase
MSHDASLNFHLQRRHGSITTPEARAESLENPGFGRVFTDHMVTIRYSSERGWHEATVEPRAPIALDPAAAVLHYAQEIFEGMKAYRTRDGRVVLFRPHDNAQRFQQSAARLAMPMLPTDSFIEALHQLVSVDRDWIPDGERSLYLRPFMIATEPFLGVKPASEYLFVTIASVAGAYFQGEEKALSIWISDAYSRAAPGGTGSAKCGGNYAAGLLAQAEAARNGCDQVLFVDAAQRQWVEELGGMNVFFVFKDGSMLTPPLNGCILPGITRASLLTLADDLGVPAVEKAYSLEQLQDDAKSGHLIEAFACGTAAVLAGIGTIKMRQGEFVIGNGHEGVRTRQLRSKLVGIQRGECADTHGWVHRVL